jgi:hypothetical protein
MVINLFVWLGIDIERSELGPVQCRFCCLTHESGEADRRLLNARRASLEAQPQSIRPNSSCLEFFFYMVDARSSIPCLDRWRAFSLLTKKQTMPLALCLVHSKLKLGLTVIVRGKAYQGSKRPRRNDSSHIRPKAEIPYDLVRFGS